MGNAADAVAFGRADSHDERLYIGRHLIRGEDGELLVISWKSRAAAKFYGATPADPMGVTRKRTYDCDGNVIKDFADVLFGLGLEPERFDEFLQRVLSRGRTGSMRDIVATIQALQYDVIQARIDQVLVIEGGPGTGKTAIALHRASWMLAQPDARLNPSDILIVGPSATFTRYIRDVLPVLGDSEVPVRHIGQLAPEVAHVGRAEEGRAAALKGDARMAGMLVRALESRIGTPEPVERLPGDGGFTSVPGVDIAAIITDCRERPLPYTERRAMFRERLGELVAQRGRVRTQALANLVDRLWPPQSAAAFLHGLLGSRRRLEAAGVPDLTAEEMMLLFRQGNSRVAEEVWSAGDLHLIDELQHLIDGDTPTYRHIVVDEVQDQSPMQLRSVARRSATGALTVVGDIAQSTGWWARDDWADVTRHLPAKLPVTVERLRYGYRVPRPAYEFAARLLPVIAPTAQPPEVIRDGANPTLHSVAPHERAGRVAAVATGHAAAGHFVGIICPDLWRREVESALTSLSAMWNTAEELGLQKINVVSPVEARGLEFDAVVVVEPEDVVAESNRGLRMLYVALTRTTDYLDVVAVGDPLPLAPIVRLPQQWTTEVSRERVNQQLAEQVAGQIRTAAPPQEWQTILAAVARELET